MAREFKDSGIEWIGQIPKEWEVNKIGNLYQVRNEKVSDKDYPPLSVTMNGIVPQLETAAKTNNGDDRKLVCKGDFAINSRSDRRGSCGVSQYDGSVSLINTILKPRGSMNPQYYNWLFHTELFADEFYRWGHGIVDDLWTTRWQEMKNISIVYPSLPEQQKIADYLDKVCGEVDEMVALQETMIEELKAYKQSVIRETITKGLGSNVFMKKSGSLWIGDFPNTWKLTRMGDVGEYKKGPFGSAITLDMFVPKGEKTIKVYEQQNAIKKDWTLGYYYISEDYFNSNLKSFEVLPNDLIVSCAGTIGEVYQLPQGIERGIINQALMRMRINDTIHLSYFLYVFDLILKGEAERSSNGTAIKNIPPFSVLKKILIPLPPFSEQQEISSYLDEKCSEIDSLIALKQTKIEELKEYKKSVIYEYVTGKKEVC